MSPIHEVNSLQPHSGIVILALYHYKKFPDKKSFDIRMTEPRSKSYSVTIEGTTRDEVTFRIGKDWPCYSRVFFNSADKFRINHDHSSVTEEFTISGRSFYNGSLRTEDGMKVKFEGDFSNPKTMELTEEFEPPNGGHISSRRYYQIDRVS